MQLSPKHILRSFWVSGLCLCATLVLAQAGQLSPGLVPIMPNLPQPYEMRDWKAVARGADSLMFDADATGDYLPLVRYRRPYNGSLLTDSIFGVPSFVGDTRGEGLEGILTLPSVVSGLLMGIDKRDQDGVDYVRMTQDWFSRRDNEFVYLNLPLTSTGQDWWYETMPNVFFQHIYALARPYGVADQHFKTVADQWAEVVSSLGGSTTPWQAGNFNYRSFRIRDWEPVAGGVPEPEAAGAIAYILENAWRETGDHKYRYAAEQALEFLDNLSDNPRYELQLYYGVQAAARLNATERTTYDLEKILGWSLSRGNLRGWGPSTTTANGYDLDGLVGEVGTGNDYLFYMNGAQAVGTLAPVARYDNRFARAIGKYILNVANNSRLFYSNYLPADQQSSFAWSSTYDPKSYLAYEAIRERLNGESPYATGDAERLGWAPTNIGVYGSAHTGYLAAVVEQTNVDGVLELNLNATDFLAPASFPTSLIYNPFADQKVVTLSNPTDSLADVYEAISNTWLARDVNSDYQLLVPSDEARIITWTPAGKPSRLVRERLFIDTTVVDYSGTFSSVNLPPRLKAAAFDVDSAAIGDTITLHTIAYDDRDEPDVNLITPSTGAFRVLDVDTFENGNRLEWTIEVGQQIGEFPVALLVLDDATLPGGYTITLKVVAEISAVSTQGYKQLQVYPNPSRDFIRMNLPPGQYSVAVYNMQGQLVQQKIMSGSEALNLHGLAPATYQLIISGSDSRLYRSRIIVLP